MSTFFIFNATAGWPGPCSPVRIMSLSFLIDYSCSTKRFEGISALLSLVLDLANLEGMNGIGKSSELLMLKFGSILPSD